MTDWKACELMGEMRRLEAGGGIYDKEGVSGGGDCFCYRT